MNNLFDSCPERHSTESLKWQKYGPGVLPMWVADMDFLSPEPVRLALRKRVEHGIFGYAGEVPELKNAIVDWLKDHYNWSVASQDILFLPGVVTGFNLVVSAFLGNQEGIVFQTPAYPPFFHISGNFDLIQEETALVQNPEGSYAIDFDQFETAFSDRTRMFLLCNPQNPTGRVFSRKELEKMAEISLRNKVLICSDEIHCDLVYRGHKHIPIASLDTEIAQNTITLMAPSKTFNIAGLEFSFAIVQNPELRNQLEIGRKDLVGHGNILGLAASLAGYRDGQPWLTELLTYLEGNRDFLYDYICKRMPGIRMAKPEGTYLSWLDCRDLQLPGNPHQFFLEKAKVSMNNGDNFGKGGSGFVRLNFGCPRQMLQEGLQRMEQAIEAL